MPTHTRKTREPSNPGSRHTHSSRGAHSRSFTSTHVTERRGSGHGHSQRHRATRPSIAHHTVAGNPHTADSTGATKARSTETSANAVHVCKPTTTRPRGGRGQRQHRGDIGNVDTTHTHSRPAAACTRSTTTHASTELATLQSILCGNLMLAVSCASSITASMSTCKRDQRNMMLPQRRENAAQPPKRRDTSLSQQ
jgi:hypothetical protein